MVSSVTGPPFWRDVIGVSLPPRDELDTFVAQFFNSVDWFMMVSSNY